MITFCTGPGVATLRWLFSYYRAVVHVTQSRENLWCHMKDPDELGDLAVMAPTRLIACKGMQALAIVFMTDLRTLAMFEASTCQAQHRTRQAYYVYQQPQSGWFAVPAGDRMSARTCLRALTRPKGSTACSFETAPGGWYRDCGPMRPRAHALGRRGCRSQKPALSTLCLSPADTACRPVGRAAAVWRNMR